MKLLLNYLYKLRTNFVAFYDKSKPRTKAGFLGAFRRFVSIV